MKKLLWAIAATLAVIAVYLLAAGEVAISDAALGTVVLSDKLAG